MAKKKRREPVILEKVMITDIAAEGKAIAKVDDLVIFVPYVVPGDIVDLRLRRKRKRYAEAEAIFFHEYSATRSEPFCEHFGICGGCKWQMLPYNEQLKFKQQQVYDNLKRIGKVDFPNISPIIGSKKTTFYRNKLEFTFSNKRWLTREEIEKEVVYEQMNALGFHIPGAFDKVLDINKCWLQTELSNTIRNEVRKYALEHDLPFFDLREHEGMLRNLIIRTSSTGEIMVILSCQIKSEKEELQFSDILQHLANTFPQITSLQYVVNNKANEIITDLDIKTFKGSSYLYEEMEDLKFKVGPISFYQTNSEQAYELYKVTRDFAKLKGDELVYDLYTGTGTIANFIARTAKNVVGIEYIPEAIEDAKENSAINNIKNTKFFAGDMKDILTPNFIIEHGQPDVIITDPPRAGMHKDVVDVILQTAPQRIVYVSCNPTTQARDVELLNVKYQVVAVQPVDMFPHTQHVENVILLEKRIENE